MDKPFALQPVTLEGSRVTLRPLAVEDADPLAALVAAQRLDLHPHTAIPAPQRMAHYIAEALDEQTAGRALPFVVIERATAQVAGTTRFCRAVPPHRRLEIGYSWLGQQWRGRGINRQMKWLMLDHAFTALGALRVEFHTDLLNRQSQRALEKIGALREGLLRHHMVMPSGRIRDSLIYSIVASDWPSLAAGWAASDDPAPLD